MNKPKISWMSYEVAGETLKITLWFNVMILLYQCLNLYMYMRCHHARPYDENETMITAGITIAITLFQWLLALAIIKHKAWARVAGILYGLLLIALFNVFTTPLGVLLLIGLTKGWAAENPAPETQ